MCGPQDLFIYISACVCVQYSVVLLSLLYNYHCKCLSGILQQLIANLHNVNVCELAGSNVAASLALLDSHRTTSSCTHLCSEYFLNRKQFIMLVFLTTFNTDFTSTCLIPI